MSKKSLYFPICVLAVLILALFITSCKDSCKKVHCDNGGTCVDGTCDCPPGYSGPNCSAEARADYLGTFNVTETCPNLSTYTTNISADTINISQVFIAGFYNNSFSNPIEATVSDTHITIGTQSPDNDGRSVSGEGQLYPPDKIVWSYTISDVNTGSTVSCDNSVWLKSP